MSRSIRPALAIMLGLGCSVTLVAAESGPIDALAPVNQVSPDERIRQLEARILLLERRLMTLETAQNVVPAVRYVQSQGALLPVPVVPVPERQQEVNGVKFKVFLLSTERSKPE